MGKLKSLFVKVLTVILIAGTIPSLSGLHVAKAEGANDPAPFINPKNPNGKKVLFDNTHGETAGAADWVIDGAFSDFANAIADQGYYVKELRKTTPITYDDLKGYNVFVLGESNIPFKKSEQDAMLQYVQNGGSIFFIGDHYNSDRNLNRWDSGEVFNGFRRGAWSDPTKGMTKEEASSQAMQGVVSSDWLGENFGIRFRTNALGDITGGETVVKPDQSFGIIQGVTTVEMHAGATLAILDPTKAKGLIYMPKNPPRWGSAVDQGVYNNGGIEEGAFAAISKVGKGKAAFLGDSSPVEDSTPKYVREDNGKKKTTYDGFLTEGQDAIYLINTINWLANQEDYTSFDKVPGLELSPVTKLYDWEQPQNSTEPQPEPWSQPSGGYKWYDSSTFAAGSYGSTKSAPVNPTYSFVHQATLPNAQAFQIRVKLDNLAPGQTVSGLSLGIYLTGGTQVAMIQNPDGTWPTAYNYSADFSVTADATGHASKDLSVKIKSGTKGAANLRLRLAKNAVLTEPVNIDNVPAEPLPEDKPNLPDQITVKEARALSADSVVTVEGIVTTTPGIFGGKGFYLQDDTAGIYVFLNDGDFKPGDKVKITAPLSVFNTELELSDPLAIEKTGTGDIPNPITVSELNDDNQGKLVKLENVQIQNLTSLKGAFEFDAVKDGKITRVRVDERTGLTYGQFTSQYKNGDVVNMSGVSSIFKGIYQLKPLSLNNFELADKTPPVIHDLDTLSFYLTDKIAENINVTDEGTGVKSVKITLDGQEVQNPIQIEPLQLALGQHTISVTAEDYAGNISTRDFVIQVMMDTDHLDELLAIGYDNGKITNHGIYNSLQAKVKNIQNANSEKVKQNMIHAFVNEVNAQKGKKIDADFADLLISSSVTTVQYEEAI
ncbi:endonuclease [Margalitia sp. FSL K6-0131]|uniref:endonuclease n=1 Tax=Margalitia sp. FSL K6-0131 TaxID=2954604 RepID=UPI0030F76E00